MLIILKHILRNIGEKKGRSILIIFSLIIASCVFILNLTIPNQIVEENKNKIRGLVGNSDLMIASYGEGFNLNDLKLNDEKINYVGTNTFYFIHKDKTVALYSTDLKKANELSLIDNFELNDDEIIINKETAEKFNYNINDIITVKINDKDFDLKIKNIVESKGLLYFKTYSGVINTSTFNKITSIPNDKNSLYFVDVENNDNIDSFEKYLNDNNKDYIIEKLVNEDEIKDSNYYVTMILLIIFVMAVIMIYFVINTLNKMIVLERTPVIATFRSIGATKYKMNRILILENAMYGLIGGILGSCLSLVINNFCVKLLLGGESLNTKVPVQNLIYGIGFSIILEIFMSIAAILKSNKYSIKELMFDNQSAKYKLSKRSSVLSILFIILSIVLDKIVDDSNLLIDLLDMVMFWLGVAYFIPVIMFILSNILSIFAKKIGNGSLIIASKNLGYNKMIISSSRLVVISIAIMIVIFNVSGTFDKMLNSFSYQFSGYDILVKETSKEDSVYKNLMNIDEIEKVDCVYMVSQDTTYNDGKKFDTNPLILGMKNSRPDIEEENYEIKKLKENEALVDSVFATNNNLKIGDTIKLKLENIDGEHEFKIVGTVNSFYYSIQREVIVINEDYFVNKISRIPFQLAITAKSGSDLKNVVSIIERELKDPDITVMTIDEFVESQRSNIHTIMYLFYVIIGLAVMLAFVGVINNQIISFMERTKELAVLNSICMSKGQLRGMLILENITSNIVACIIGFIVSVESVNLMNSVLNGIKMYIDVVFNLKIAGIFIGIILVVLFLTVVLPINKLRKINVVEAIKYE